MRRPILNHTERGDTVYDPFLGSGSTVIAAEQTGRVCYGLDIDPKYVDVTVLRWQAQSGEQAKLDGDDRSFEKVAQERVAHDRALRRACRHLWGVSLWQPWPSRSSPSWASQAP